MRSVLFPLLVLASCEQPLEPADCMPSWGSSCGCTAQCLTEREIDRIGDSCLMACPAIDWTCDVDVEENECVVVEAATE